MKVNNPNYPKPTPKTLPDAQSDLTPTPAANAAATASQPKYMRRAFTAEFKQTAVALVLEEGLPIRRAAEQLGISHQALRNWVKRAQGGQPLNPSTPKVTERDMKFLEMQAEVHRLRKEVILLKKIQAYLTYGKV